MKERKSLKRRLKNRNRSINLIILLVLLIIVVFLSPKIVSTAKYVYNAIHDNYLSSKDFYFGSDKLNLEHSEYQITNNWSGAQTYTITIDMTSKQNDMAYTESDITYTIRAECSDNIEYTLSKTQGTIMGTNHEEITEGVNTDSFSININPKDGRVLNNTEIAWIDVYATSTSPYTQTISGKLIIEVGSSNIYYEIDDSENSPYLTVNIVNSSASNANVTLSYNPQQVLLDMTNHFYINAINNTKQTLNGYEYLNSITSNVSSLSTTSVMFYKIDPTMNYTYLSSSGETPIITLSH